jgi:uncharacterized membrane protein YjgN (DUF898 family)
MDTNPPDAAPPNPEAEQRLPLVFTGSARAYFQIWVVNILLTVVTLGIYSAWAKVRRMQFFYGNTKLDGDGFNYTASPIAILKGRLIAVALILTYSVAWHFMGPWVEGALFVLVLFAFPWLMMAALRFHARFTLWRNVSFGWAGSYADVFKAYVLWPIGAMLTLGALFPFAARAMRRVKLNHLRFGTSRFETDPPLGPFYGGLFIAAVLWLGAVLGGWLVWLAFGGVMQALLPRVAAPIVAAAWAPLCAILGFLLASAWFAAAARNATLNALRLERGHRFACDLSEQRFALIRVTNFLAIVASFGLLIPWAAVRSWRYDVESVAMMPAGSLDQFMGEQVGPGGAFGAELGGFQGVEIGV